MYEVTIEPGKRGLGTLAGRSNHNDQGTSAGSRGRIHNMPDEWLAREFRENFGRIDAKARAAAGGKNDRRDSVRLPAQSGGLHGAQRFAPHRGDHLGENGDGDLGGMNRADIEPNRCVNCAELRVGQSLIAKTFQPLGMGFL